MQKKKVTISFAITLIILFLLTGVLGDEIFSDDFESGNLSAGGWTTSGTYRGWSVVDDGFTPDYAAWAYPQDSSEPGSVLTNEVNLSGYSTIQISYERKLIYFNGQDFNGIFKSKWYNGTTWHVLEENTSARDSSFVEKTYFLGNSASDNPDFRIRFECTGGSSSIHDYCYVDNIQITGSSDLTPPAFSSYLENPSNNSQYSLGQNYEFNVTIIEDNMDTTGIEFNGINYTLTNISDVYSFNISNLAAGTYSYYWWANDTKNNFNTSGVKYYTLAKAPTTTFVLATPASPITYGTQSNFSCTNTQNLTTTLYINEIQSNSQKGQNIIRAAGTYNITCTSAENQNYSSGSHESTYTINKATGQVTLLLNSIADNLTIQYPQQTNATTTTPYGTTTLYRNGQDISLEDGTNKTLGAGTYNYTAISSGNQNYTTTSTELFVNITKGTPSLTFLLNGDSDNITLTYSQNLNATAHTNDGTINLYRNNQLINSENSNNKILGAGYYEYKANITGDENHTNSPGTTYYVNITKAYPTNMQINFNPSQTVNYGTQTSATATETNTGDADLTYYLFREHTLTASSSPWEEPWLTLDAGTYYYTYNTTGGENYTTGEVNSTLTVNQLENSISLLLNTIADNLTLNYLQQLNASASSESGIIKLYRNSIDVSSENNQNKILSAGTYTYFANSSGSTNYKENTTGILFSVNINKAIPTALLTNTESWTINYTTPVTIGYSETNTGDQDVTYKIYRDGADKGSGETVILGAGEYNYSISTNGGQNYTTASNLDFQTLTVNKKTPTTTLTFDKTTPQTYGTTINVTCTTTNQETTPNLYRNGIDVTFENSENIILEAGNHNYTCNTTETQNYTSSMTTNNFTINKAEGNIKLYLNGLENDLQIEYPQQYNITATTLYGNVSIYLNETDFTLNNSQNITPENKTASYNITAYSTGDQNHTPTSITRWLNITLDTTPPTVTINLPDGTYGYNESIPLEFHIKDNNLDSCWYNLGQENTTILLLR
jgi:hypothetical protein